jgi:hypothetical protein
MEGLSDWRIKKANRKEKKLQESRKMQEWQRQKKYTIKISVRTKKIRMRCGKKRGTRRSRKPQSVTLPTVENGDNHTEFHRKISLSR